MKTKKTTNLQKERLQNYLIAVFCFLFSIAGNASHMAGMDLTYKYLGIVGTTYKYEVTAVIYLYTSATGTQLPVNPNNAPSCVYFNSTVTDLGGKKCSKIIPGAGCN